MLRIYLIRHGQNVDNANGVLNGHRDMPLTAIGESQAFEIASKIKQSGVHFDYVYSSPLSRALSTAEIVTRSLNLKSPTILPELIERDFGLMTGIDQSLIEELCAPDILKTETVTYFLYPDHGESFEQLINRASLLLKQIADKHNEGNILFVTHGDFGKMLYAAYYELYWVDVLKQFHFGNSDLLELSSQSSADTPHVHVIEQYNL